MHEKMSNSELRVLGCLMEKQLATPAYYPLTVNSLVIACNQKSNRDPVVNFAEAEVEAALHGLMGKGYASRIRSAESRVDKYGHSAGDAFDLSPAETAVLAELFLRGQQTPGELKQRASRMVGMDSLDDVHNVIEALMGQGLAMKLGRNPGQKESRYTHLLGIEAEPLSEGHTSSVEPAPVEHEQRPGLYERIEALEAEVRSLRNELNALRRER